MAGVYRTHDYDMDQGDLLEGVPLLVRRGKALSTDFASLGLVTSHGCQWDKYTVARDRGQDRVDEIPMHVAPVSSTSHIPAGKLGDIRKGRVRDMFLIPADEGLPEFVVHLSQEQPVPAEVLIGLPRRRTLSDDMWNAFVIHRFIYQTRFDPDAVVRAFEALKEDS